MEVSAEPNTEGGTVGNEEPTVDNKEIRCLMCGTKYLNVSALKRHVKSFHEGGSKQCDICDRFFKSEEALLKHKRRHLGYTCDVCDKSFASNESLKVHRFKFHKKASDTEKEGSKSKNKKSKKSNQDSESATGKDPEVSEIQDPQPVDLVSEEEEVSPQEENGDSASATVIDIDMY